MGFLRLANHASLALLGALAMPALSGCSAPVANDGAGEAEGATRSTGFDSKFTSLLNCKDVTPEDKRGQDAYEGLCPGVGGYQLKIVYADERDSVRIVQGEREDRLNLHLTVSGNFSRVNDRRHAKTNRDPVADWRTHGGEPVAVTFRYIVQDDEAHPGRDHDLLVVAKLAPTACVIGVVDTEKPDPTTPSVRARAIAEKAETTECPAGEGYLPRQ